MRARASAKAILLGEHAVVHGVPAIAIPITARATEVDVVATDASREIEIVDERGRGGEAGGVDSPRGDTELAARMTRLALDMTDAPAKGARVRIRSTIPLGGGLGSSAALAVALVRATDPRVHDVAEVARRANELERLAHGTPSGIDAAVIAWERPIVFEKGKEPRPLAIGAPLKFAIGVLPRTGTTASLVAGVRKLRETDAAKFEGALAAIRALVDAATRDMTTAMATNRALLRDLGVSTPAVEAACDAAIAAGALAAKLSGAGGGGAVIALLGPPGAPDLRGAKGGVVCDPDRVLAALRGAGALDAFITEVPATA